MERGIRHQIEQLEKDMINETLQDTIITAWFTPVQLMEQRRTVDELGSFVTVYEPGAEFEAAIVFNSDPTVQIAMSSTAKGEYTITVNPNTPLRYHDILKRKSDGKYFRITSDAENMHTPSISTFQFWQCTAEEWRI